MELWNFKDMECQLFLKPQRDQVDKELRIEGNKLYHIILCINTLTKKFFIKMFKMKQNIKNKMVTWLLKY